MIGRAPSSASFLSISHTMAAHIARRNMAGVNWGKSRGEQRQKGRLRPLETEGDLVIAVRGDLFEVPVPGLTRIDAELLTRLAGEQVPGAFDILGRERPAVVPLDPLAKREG